MLRIPKHTMEKKTEDIYTQNLQGLWRRARDENSQIVVNVESDTTKLNVIIDKMEKINQSNVHPRNMG